MKFSLYLSTHRYQIQTMSCLGHYYHISFAENIISHTWPMLLGETPSFKNQTRHKPQGPMECFQNFDPHIDWKSQFKITISKSIVSVHIVWVGCIEHFKNAFYVNVSPSIASIFAEHSGHCPHCVTNRTVYCCIFDSKRQYYFTHRTVVNLTRLELWLVSSEYRNNS